MSPPDISTSPTNNLTGRSPIIVPGSYDQALSHPSAGGNFCSVAEKVTEQVERMVQTIRLGKSPSTRTSEGIAQGFYDAAQVLGSLLPDELVLEISRNKHPRTHIKDPSVEVVFNTIQGLVSRLQYSSSSKEGNPSIYAPMRVHLGADSRLFLLGKIGFPQGSISQRDASNVGKNLGTLTEKWGSQILHNIKNEQVSELDRLRGIDTLTGIGNRYAFFIRDVPELTETVLEEDIFLLAFDLDHFKKINDIYGHPAGDKVLKGVAITCQDLCEQSGYRVYRIGGEEFMIIGTGSSTEAVQFAEVVRKSIENLSFDTRDLHGNFWTIKPTVSVGGITHRTGLVCPTFNPDILVSLGDEALYEAKGGGRNKVVFKNGGSEPNWPPPHGVSRKKERNT